MLVKSVTEIIHCFSECFLFGINTRAADTWGAAVLSLAHMFGAGSCPPAAMAT